jgi:hypothetical protein
MNLGKLLSVGKSIFGNGETAAYRLNRRTYLPKFNEGRNPFALRVAESESVESAAVNPPADAVAKKSPPPYAFKPKLARASRRVLASAPPPAEATKPVRSGWTARLNPFRASEPEVVRPAVVQTELSLDAVKVVHNDLADADVEMVPMKSNTEAVVTPPALPPARRAWEYIGENLLKS